jgi:hypothetical protein
MGQRRAWRLRVLGFDRATTASFMTGFLLINIVNYLASVVFEAMEPASCICEVAATQEKVAATLDRRGRTNPDQ